VVAISRPLRSRSQDGAADVEEIAATAKDAYEVDTIDNKGSGSYGTYRCAKNQHHDVLHQATVTF
jgi:hypothetical protein